jgi:MFS family permease
MAHGMFDADKGAEVTQGATVGSQVPEVDPQPLGETTSAGRPLAVPSFRLLFGGQAASVLGDRLVMVAMPFAVLSIDGAGASDVGLVLGAGALSLGGFVLIGGVWADRLPRRATMLGSDVVRAVLQAGAAALLLSGHATVLWLVVVQLLFGAAEAFFRPAMLALIPELLEPDSLQPANALLALSSNISMVIGPVIAGVLVAVIGAGGALAVDSATFCVSAATLLVMRVNAPVVRSERRPFLTELREGWSEVRSRGWVWSTILGFSGYHALVLPALFVLGPIVAEDIRGGATAWGVISAAFGVGAVFGSIVSLRWRPRRPGVVLALSLLVAASQAAIVTSSWPTWVVAAAEAITGVVVAFTFTIWETALQRNIPGGAQARVSSFDYLGSLTLMPIGFAVMGPLADAVGVRTVGVIASAVSAAICLAILGNRSLRGLR